MTEVSILALFSLAFVLGLRHGFDPDHLAVIDGLARLNADTRPRLARACGALFSIGHGSIMVAGVALVAALAERWAVPAWVEYLGGAVSVTFLVVLGVLNVHAAWTTPAGQIVRPIGARARLVGQVRRPLGVVAIGMLFALSFDTLSQAVLFGLAGIGAGGWPVAIGVSLCFVLGMIATDGLNSLWVTRLVRAADRRAAIASRIMTTTIGIASLAVAGIAMAAMLLPGVSHWADASGVWIGATVVASGVVALLLGAALTRQRSQVA